jgi:hypothetical protein
MIKKLEMLNNILGSANLAIILVSIGCETFSFGAKQKPETENFGNSPTRINSLILSSIIIILTDHTALKFLYTTVYTQWRKLSK